MLAARGQLHSCLECRQKGLDKHRFCNEDAPYPLYEFDGEEIRRCPVGLIRPESFAALEAYGFYNKGHLPRTGGWEDQPNRIMEQMLIIAAAISEAQKNARKK